MSQVSGLQQVLCLGSDLLNYIDHPVLRETVGHCFSEEASTTCVIRSSPLKICIKYSHPPQTVLHDRNINIVANEAITNGKKCG